MCKMNLTRYEGNAKVSLDRKLKNDEGQNEKQLRTCILFRHCLRFTNEVG